MFTLVRKQSVMRYLLFLCILIVLGVFLLWPIFLTVQGGFRTPQGAFTFKYLQSVFQDPLWMAGLGNSLMIATATTCLCLVFTMPMALLAAKYDFPGKTIMTSLLLIPLILPPFVGAIGLRALLGRFGAVNALLLQMGFLEHGQPGFDFLGGGEGGRFWGVVVMEALHLYPIIYLNITAAIANLDPALNEAALGLGAGKIRRFFKVTLPLIIPGVFAGSTIVFIWSFTELGTPLMFDYYTVTPVQIYWGIQEVQSNPRPYALVVVMLSVAVGLYLLSKLAFGGKSYAMQGRAAIASTTKRLGGVYGVLALFPFVLLTGLAVMPHLGVVFSSFSVDGAWYRSILPKAFTTEHYTHALAHPLAMGAIKNSLVYALGAVTLTVIIGLSISYLTVRCKIRGGWLLDSLAMLPLAVPGLVMAFGYVAMSLNWPFVDLNRYFEANGWTYLASLCQITGKAPNPLAFLIVAYGIRRLPYVVRCVSAGLQQTSGELEEAALSLGASTATTLRKVVVPLIMANIIAGAILAFAFSMLEVSDSLILAQKESHYPITKAIFEFFNRLGDGPYIASAMGVWGMALLTITLVGASILMGKKLGAIFRV
ncbi:MAG: iron ABC transporter permease [Phycisphaeraceae bacterium]|nr:iron ABC transporter permease [Phycisphaeraceae bacterium]